MVTLPTISQRSGIALDALRSFVRKTPALAALGAYVGASRAFTEAEVATILAAWQRKQAARTGKVKPEVAAHA